MAKQGSRQAKVTCPRFHRELLAEPGLPTPDPGFFSLLQKNALSWKTNNVDKELKGLIMKVQSGFPIYLCNDLLNLPSIHSLERHLWSPYLCQAGFWSQDFRGGPSSRNRDLW